MPKTITIICQFCGNPVTKELKEYTRKIKNGRGLFCNQSCGAKFNNNQRKEEKEATLPPPPPMTEADAVKRYMRLRQVIMMRDEHGAYMPLDWVSEQVRKLYPELSVSLESKTIDEWRELCNQEYYWNVSIPSQTVTVEEVLLKELNLARENYDMWG